MGHFSRYCPPSKHRLFRVAWAYAHTDPESFPISDNHASSTASLAYVDSYAYTRAQRDVHFYANLYRDL